MFYCFYTTLSWDTTDWLASYNTYMLTYSICIKFRLRAANIMAVKLTLHFPLLYLYLYMYNVDLSWPTFRPKFYLHKCNKDSNSLDIIRYKHRFIIHGNRWVHKASNMITKEIDLTDIQTLVHCDFKTPNLYQR